MRGRFSRDYPFIHLTHRYDRWFDRYHAVYRSELHAIQQIMIPFSRGLDIGVGTGRFASPLGFRFGVDPALPPLRLAQQRDVWGILGRGEFLPIRSECVDAVLVVTTLCFVDDWSRVLREIRRVLKRNSGFLYIGMVDRDSFLGRRYLAQRDRNPFYRYAVFFSVPEVLDSLTRYGFAIERIVQTVFDVPEAVHQPHPVRPGWGEGAFVAIRSRVFRG